MTAPSPEPPVTTTTILRMPETHNGPDGIAQGGLLAGRLLDAARLDPRQPVEVTLRAPGPLGVPLEVEQVGSHTTLWADATLVAEARPVGTPPSAVPAVPLEVAARVAGGLAARNPFPRCVVCGHERPEGLGVRPGAVVGTDMVAGVLPSRPGGLSLVEVTGALDCTSGHALLAGSSDGVAVTGRVRLALSTTPPADTDLVVVGDSRPAQGRSLPTRAAAYTPGGVLVAAAEVTWVRVSVP